MIRSRWDTVRVQAALHDAEEAVAHATLCALTGPPVLVEHERAFAAFGREQSLGTGVYTRDELRAILGMPPLGAPPPEYVGMRPSGMVT